MTSKNCEHYHNHDHPHDHHHDEDNINEENEGAYLIIEDNKKEKPATGKQRLAFLEMKAVMK